jgi:hypothetical protein
VAVVVAETSLEVLAVQAVAAKAALEIPHLVKHLVLLILEAVVAAMVVIVQAIHRVLVVLEL